MRNHILGRDNENKLIPRKRPKKGSQTEQNEKKNQFPRQIPDWHVVDWGGGGQLGVVLITVTLTPPNRRGRTLRVEFQDFHPLGLRGGY